MLKATTQFFGSNNSIDCDVLNILDSDQFLIAQYDTDIDTYQYLYTDYLVLVKIDSYLLFFQLYK